MKTITIEIPEGKEAKWVNGVLTLVDEQPVEFKFKVGDKVFCTTDSFVYTILDRYIFNGEPWYKVDESGLDGCSEYELEPYTEPQDITERIKTFEDACEWCTENGHHNIRREYDCIVTDTLILDEVSPDLIAYLKLRIITCALNEGWEPRPYQNDMRYYAIMNDQCTDVIRIAIATAIGASTPHTLYFKTRDLAYYAATQFKDIYMDFCHKGKE